MSEPLVALVTVVNGAAYERYAERMFESAGEFFRPTDPHRVSHFTFAGREGWPDATLYRYHVVKENWPRVARFTHLFMVDADMRFEGPVGPEILAERGVTATLHPGYVGKSCGELPYERRPVSKAYVSVGTGERYYAGGFVGGTTGAWVRLMKRITWRIQKDAERDLVPVWHDESVLNAVLVANPPEVVLSPAYCHPDNDSFYVEHVWPERYPRLLVALDKPAAERQGR